MYFCILHSISLNEVKFMLFFANFGTHAHEANFCFYSKYITMKTYFRDGVWRWLCAFTISFSTNNIDQFCWIWFFATSTITAAISLKWRSKEPIFPINITPIYIKDSFCCQWIVKQCFIVLIFIYSGFQKNRKFDKQKKFDVNDSNQS